MSCHVMSYYVMLCYAMFYIISIFRMLSFTLALPNSAVSLSNSQVILVSVCSSTLSCSSLSPRLLFISTFSSLSFSSSLSLFLPRSLALRIFTSLSHFLSLYLFLSHRRHYLTSISNNFLLLPTCLLNVVGEDIDLEIPPPLMSCLGGAIGRPIETSFRRENLTYARDFVIRKERKKIIISVKTTWMLKSELKVTIKNKKDEAGEFYRLRKKIIGRNYF